MIGAGDRSSPGYRRREGKPESRARRGADRSSLASEGALGRPVAAAAELAGREPRVLRPGSPIMSGIPELGSDVSSGPIAVDRGHAASPRSGATCLRRSAAIWPLWTSLRLIRLCAKCAQDRSRPTRYLKNEYPKPTKARRDGPDKLAPTCRSHWVPGVGRKVNPRWTT